MAGERVGTLSYLRAVMDRFGSEEGKYAAFFRIFSDFKKKVDGDEIIRRTKELFDGDEMMIMGFYRLLLEQKRKNKKPDDFGEALTVVCQLMSCHKEEATLKSFSEILYMFQKNNCTLDAYRKAQVVILEPKDATIPHQERAHGMLGLRKFSILPTHVQKMGENKRSCSNDIDDNVDRTGLENRKQRRVRTDSREGNMKIPENDCGKLDNICHVKKIPQRVDCSCSSNDHENSMTGFLRNGGHISSSGTAEGRDRLVEHDVANGKKMRNVEHPKNKEEMRHGRQHSPDSNNVTFQRASLSANGKGCTKPVSELDLSICPIYTPSYQLIPEELRVPSVSQKTKLDASVLNDCCVSVKTGVYSVKTRSNKYEDSLFLCEDDMFELDVLLGSLKATIKKVKGITTKMSDKKIYPDFHFQIEKYFTSSNLRCIEQLYDTHRQDILDAIRQNADMLSSILYRLEQRRKELEAIRLDFHKLCRDVFAENYPKLHESRAV